MGHEIDSLYYLDLTHIPPSHADGTKTCSVSINREF
jgi:hypothetical protein